MSKYAPRKTFICLVVIIWVMKSRIWSLAAPNDDMSSLLALKHRITITNNNTMLSNNWTQETPFCSWIGVTCSRRHRFRVTALNLSYVGLHGTIPEEIGNLSFLSYLNIRNNSFSGPIPDTIGRLSRLRELRMNYNQLSGQIPQTIGMLRKLENLILYNNQLEGTIPTSVFNISSLRIIYLHNNRLSGNLPQEDIWPNLQQLFLAYNQLSGSIPRSIFNISSLMEISLLGNQLSGSLDDLDFSHRLPQLQVLQLSKNNLSGSIPIHIGNLSQLQGLDIYENQLTGMIPTSIGNLSKLEVLEVGDNNLHGTFPREIGELFNLQVLNLESCNLNGEIPASLYNLSRLEIVAILDNELFGELPSSISTGLPNLKYLYIEHNRLSGAIPSSISNFSRLIGLDLGYNSFSGHAPVNLGSLSNLEVLSLAGNNFTNNLSMSEQDFLSPLAKCKYLTMIWFDRNPTITGELSKPFFSSSNVSDTLQHFLADHCGISGEIPTEIGNLSSLIQLDIGYNNLVGEIPESFQKLKNLQSLDLSDNMLQGSIPHSICNMTNLYLLSLSRNNLSGQLPLCFGTHLLSLQELYLSGNAFTSDIPSTIWNGKIEFVYLDNNFFDGILSPEIGNSKSLMELDLSSNRLSGNISDSIGQLQTLRFLSISNNKLNGSIADSLSNLISLETLDLSKNNLSGPIPKSLANLTHLANFNVSFNKLTGEIPNEGCFENFGAESFIGNRDLCGAARLKVNPCKFAKSKASHKSKIISRFILPPVLALLIFVAASTIFFVIRHRQRKSTEASTHTSDYPARLSLDRISYSDIRHATRNFDGGNVIGIGGFGSVYKAEFSDTVVAAVKVFNLDIQGALKSFDVECEILRSIRHRNLVKVITSCSNLDFKALVMEYMPNGSLAKWLYSTEYSLNIFQRLEIMVDVAVALQYLHHGSSTPIIHCDLKPSNILLDTDMVARVGDFGIAKLLTEEGITHQTKTMGTVGYMAPEYGLGGFISTAADVYSYGIVMMETLTRKKPTDEMFSEELTMKKWVSESFFDLVVHILNFELPNTIEEDARDIYHRCLTSIFGLAVECTSEIPEERPSMNEVARKIRKFKTELKVV